MNEDKKKQKDKQDHDHISDVATAVDAMQTGNVTKSDKFSGMPELKELPRIDKSVFSVISEDIARKYKMAPFAKEGKMVKIAMVDPDDFEAVNILRFVAENAKLEFDIYFTSEEIFQEIMKQYANTEKAVEAAMMSLQTDDVEGIFDTEKEEKGNKEVIQDAPITKLLSVIIKHAIEGKASDIHIEPLEKSCRIRFRVDGILHSSLTVPREVGRAVVARIKILANLKIDENRKPQDGRFKVADEGGSIDFRVSTLPIVEGEKVVLRLLDKGSKVIDVETLGLMGRNKDILLKKIRDPFGIILITGPTGSGKSTTLYSFLQILNKEERNIVTLEDPVEYSVEGVNQSQIKPEIGYTFASGLRSILRQDPNVIMVGEIRDTETAELSIHAALTGHLVFSTLHTNTSIGAVPRLIDMGIEAFLLSSSLQAVAAQRLVRKICENCKEIVHMPSATIEYIKKELSAMRKEDVKGYDIDISKEFVFYHGKGCEECNNTGYKGRIAIFEALEVDNELKEIIAEHNGGENDIKQYAEKMNMISMKQDGIIKVLKGLTTFSEIERVTEGSLNVGGDVDDDRG
jgi:type IV pilus assembly protein PilB